MFTITSISSIELVIDISLVRKTGVLFDERFGLGTEFASGAENIFARDLLSYGDGCFINKTIVCHDGESSGGGLGQDQHVFSFRKGAVYKRLYGPLVGFAYLLAFYVYAAFLRKPRLFKVHHLIPLFSGFYFGPVRRN